MPKQYKKVDYSNRKPQREILLKYLENNDYESFVKAMCPTNPFNDLKCKVYIIGNQKLLLLDNNSKIIKTFIDSLLNQDVDKPSETITKTIDFLFTILPVTVLEMCYKYLNNLQTSARITEHKHNKIIELFENAYPNQDLLKKIKKDLLKAIKKEHEESTEEITNDEDDSTLSYNSSEDDMSIDNFELAGASSTDS